MKHLAQKIVGELFKAGGDFLDIAIVVDFGKTTRLLWKSCDEAKMAVELERLLNRGGKALGLLAIRQHGNGFRVATRTLHEHRNKPGIEAHMRRLMDSYAMQYARLGTGGGAWLN
jgi:hypothetical protein